jgi:hypothetical protein
MLTPPTELKVFVATKPVDFSKGADGLVLLPRTCSDKIHCPAWRWCFAPGVPIG